MIPTKRRRENKRSINFRRKSPCEASKMEKELERLEEVFSK